MQILLELGTEKPFFKIGEAAEIVGVAPHVLRYWEQAFPGIRPRKSKGKQRLYRRADIATLLQVKHLLYERKFTVAGARSELRKGEAVPMALPDLRYRLRQSLSRVQVQVDALRAALLQGERRSARAADPAAYLRELEAQASSETAA